MSKTKTAAAFALGFIVGSSKWLWIAILASGALHFIAASKLEFLVTTDFGVEVAITFVAGLAVGGMTVAGNMTASHTRSTGPK